MNRSVLSWYFYDWGNSAFATVVMAAVLPVFFANYVASGLAGSAASSYWGYANTLSMLIIAVFAPFLGAVADVRGKKKFFLAVFTLLGVVSTALLGLAEKNDILFVLLAYLFGRVGFSAANIFYDSLLPHITADKERDKVSSLGYSLGYLGGGLFLAISLLWIMSPEQWGFADTSSAIRATFVGVAVWWMIFSLPVFKYIPEPPPTEGPKNELALFETAWNQTLRIFAELKSNREVLKFLAAYFLYNDGIGTIMVMAAIYGSEIGIPSGDLVGAILLVQFIGVPATWLFSKLADKITTKHAIITAISGYLLISAAAFWISTPFHFWLMAGAVGLVQGGAQALSRSFYANMIPKEKSAEYFSFYDIFSKFSSIMGPFVFALVADYSGSSRYGILTLVLFFGGGIWVLSSVKTKEVYYATEKLH